MNTTHTMSGNDPQLIWFFVGCLLLMLAAMAIDYTLAAMRGELEKD